MGGRGWKIGSIAGIPIRIDSSWLFVAVLYTYFLYTEFLLHPEVIGKRGAIGLAVFAAALFFGSVFVHEVAHAAVARSLGIPVAGITLVIWGGFTETRAEREGPRGEFLISVAGPLSSLALGGIFWLAARAVDPSLPGVAVALDWLAYINVLLAVLNALPGFPLDGGRALQAVVWKVSGNRRTATRFAAGAGLLIGIAFAAVAFLLVLRQMIYPAFWLGYIAYVLISSARSSERRLTLRDALSGGTAREAMQPAPPSVPATMALSEVLDRYLRGHEQESFPVSDGNRIVGMISFQSARKLGVEDPLRPARDAMIPVADVRTVQAGQRLDEVVDVVGGGGAALVLEGDELAGSIRAIDLETWLNGSRRPSPATLTAPPRPDRQR